MPDTIENPTADQLEAGGRVSGTYYGLPFTDQELRADTSGALYIGKHCWITYSTGHRIRESVTVTSYTPPEPKPWWETCDPETPIEYDIGGGRRVVPAWVFVSWNSPENRERTNPRRVLVADADTEVIVPKAALNDLRRRHSSNLGTDRVAVRLFLVAVDERGE